MEESENIKEVVNQVAIQVAMVVIMALRDTEAGSKPTSVVSHEETQWANTGKTSVSLGHTHNTGMLNF